MCISLSSIKISFVLNLLLGIVVLQTSKGWWQTEYGPAFKNFEYPCPRGRPKKTLKEVIKFKMYESELV